MNGANQLVMKNIINYNGKSPTVEMNDKILVTIQTMARKSKE